MYKWWVMSVIFYESHFICCALIVQKVTLAIGFILSVFWGEFQSLPSKGLMLLLLVAPFLIRSVHRIFLTDVTQQCKWESKLLSSKASRPHVCSWFFKYVYPLMLCFEKLVSQILEKVMFLLCSPFFLQSGLNLNAQWVWHGPSFMKAVHWYIYSLFVIFFFLIKSIIICF